MPGGAEDGLGGGLTEARWRENRHFHATLARGPWRGRYRTATNTSARGGLARPSWRDLSSGRGHECVDARSIPTTAPASSSPSTAAACAQTPPPTSTTSSPRVSPTATSPTRSPRRASMSTAAEHAAAIEGTYQLVVRRCPSAHPRSPPSSRPHVHPATMTGASRSGDRRLERACCWLVLLLGLPAAALLAFQATRARDRPRLAGSGYDVGRGRACRSCSFRWRWWQAPR